MGSTIGKIAVGAALIGAAFLTGGASIAPTISIGSGALATATITTGLALSTTALGSTLLVAGSGAILGGLTQGKPGLPQAQISRTAPSLDPATYRKAVYGETAMPFEVRWAA